MDTNKPTISVIMPVYNAEKYVKHAIDSILNQSYKDFEFIIINDSSTDATEKKILRYKDKRIKYYVNEENLGVAKTLNKGLKYAKGKYIARMDADDISMSDRFKEQLELMEEYDVVGTNIILINEEGKIISVRNYDKNIDKTIKTKSPLAHPTVMFKKTLIKKRGYREEFLAAQDYDLWFYFYSQGAKITNTDTSLLFYRQHKDTIKNTKTKQTIRDTLKAKQIAQKEYKIKFNTKEKIRILIEKTALLFPSKIILKVFKIMEGVRK